MLYKLETENGRFNRISPQTFSDFSSFGHLEKDLENLIASNLLEVLFEKSRLMPIFQQRQWQPEAAIYALNELGELVIFELKRGSAGNDAVQQALRYAQTAGQWTFTELQSKFQQQLGRNAGLTQAHQEAFGLELPLQPAEFNRRQILYVLGSSSDPDLMNSVAYWKRQGLTIEFLPYRVYEIGEGKYFEFFSPPFDTHRNPAELKGVIFDTNRTWDEEAIWYMMSNKRVMAFGDAKRFIERVHPGDIVFFSHRFAGLVAAARVRGGPIQAPDPDTKYRNVEFLTPIPDKDKPMRAMPFSDVSEVTGKRFYWASIIKAPYLEMGEAELLVEKLNQCLMLGD